MITIILLLLIMSCLLLYDVMLYGVILCEQSTNGVIIITYL